MSSGRSSAHDSLAGPVPDQRRGRSRAAGHHRRASERHAGAGPLYLGSRCRRGETSHPVYRPRSPERRPHGGECAVPADLGVTHARPATGHQRRSGRLGPVACTARTCVLSSSSATPRWCRRCCADWWSWSWWTQPAEGRIRSPTFSSAPGSLGPCSDRPLNCWAIQGCSDSAQRASGSADTRYRSAIADLTPSHQACSPESS